MGFFNPIMCTIMIMGFLQSDPLYINFKGLQTLSYFVLFPFCESDDGYSLWASLKKMGDTSRNQPEGADKRNRFTKVEF